MRTVIALALALLAAAALTATSVGLWGHRTVNDADRFGAAVGNALSEPAVSRLIAREAVGALTGEFPGVEQIRGPLTRQSSRIIRQDRFRSSASALARSAFGTLVDGRRQGLVIDVDEAFPAVRRAADRVAPELARQLPAQSNLGQVELVKAGDLPDLSPVSDAFGLAAILGGLLTLAAFGLALAVARDRGIVLAVFGIALAGASALTLVALGPATEAATAQVPDGAVQAATRAIVDSLTSPLQTQALVLLAAGAIVAVAGFLLRNRGFAGPARASTSAAGLPRRAARLARLDPGP